MSNEWAPAQQIADLRARDLETAGVVFSHGEYLYRTTGKKLGTGGMGSVYLMARRDHSQGVPHPVVGKVFHTDYLLQLQTDAVAQSEHERVMASVDAIAHIDHPHLLPTYLSGKISDNYIFVSPLRSETLREVALHGRLSAHEKVSLLLQAIDGISILHEKGFLHRDFTLRNILVDTSQTTAYLFDFDLALSLADVQNTSYKSQFQGRIFGSPGYSLAPEILDKALMELPISKSLDIYALGSSIFALFTDDLPYGEAEDLWSLLLRVSKGIVRGGRSYIHYPSSVPQVLRPIIEHCMQRTPTMRPSSAQEVASALRETLPHLKQEPRAKFSPSKTIGYGDSSSRLKRVQSSASPAARDKLGDTDSMLRDIGYVLQRSLGNVQGNEIFLATPDPGLVALGQFADGNLYPKIVSVLDYHEEKDPKLFVENWLGIYQPALKKARQGLMTSLYKIVHSDDTKLLLILTEYVEDARFGVDLVEENLDLQEAFGLAYLISQQIAALHKHGLAHNNVCAQALLLKGVHENHCVHPAMVGIVNPSQDPSHMQNDARQLALLLLSWLSDTQIAEASPANQAKLNVLQSEVCSLVESPNPCELSTVAQLCKDGLATLDFNFGVLREHGGDLEAYALVRIGHALYARLWHL